MDSTQPETLPMSEDVSAPPKGPSASRAPAYFVAYRYANHAGTSGYDRFADYLGKTVDVSPRLKTMGETVLRLPGIAVHHLNGSFEYGRHDFVHEIATLQHMLSHREGIYHFLYAEKSLRFLSRMNGRRGHRIIGSFHHCAFKYPGYFRSTRHFRPISHAVVVSRPQIPHIEKIIGKGRVSFVPYAVDADHFQPATERRDRPLRCTCIGQHLRDIDRIPGIVEGISKEVDDFEFYVIGAPKKFESIGKLPNVVWKTNIPDAEYLDILQQTDVLVLPLIDSTSITTVNEALACGVPVITNPGGISDYLNDDCAIQLPAGDEQAMAHAAVGILKDAARQREMSRHARQRGLELHWPRSAEKMQEVYDKVLADAA